MDDPVKLLAVDDVPMNLEMMEVMLWGAADHFLKAMNGAEALAGSSFFN